MNYYLQMEEQLKEIPKNTKLLLHSCCAPCSSHVITLLKDYFDITILYYNPNIAPLEEYEKRKKEQIRLLKELDSDIHFYDCDYENDIFEKQVKSLHHEKEGGKRCTVCFSLRLTKTAELAKLNHFDYFGTTLTVSPHKNAKLLNELGKKISKKYDIPFLYSDLKKKDGYKKSIELSKKYGLYRQNYCGCIYSKGENINENI